MKRFNLKTILILAAFLLPILSLRAQISYSDTIGNGSDIGHDAALPGHYGYNLSAALYTADEINHSAGYIQSLSYYFYFMSTTEWADQRLKLYLLETNSNTLDLSRTWGELTAEATLVYDSTSYEIDLFEAYYWKEFLFDTPFAYHGGNLIVLAEGYGCDLSYGGCETDIYINNGNSGNCYNRLQDGEPFSFTTPLSSLSGSQHDNETERADVFFTFNGEISDDDECVMTLPYSEDFESYDNDFTAYPECWAKYNDYISGLDYDCPIVSGGGSTYTNCLFFYLQGTATQCAILPRMEDGTSIRDVSMTFNFRSAQQFTTRIVVGVMTNPDDISTFTGVDTVFRTGSTNSNELKQVSFAPYTGNGRYIALMLHGESSSYYNCFVDDIYVFENEFCTPPAQITSTTNENGVNISWVPTTNTTEVWIYYKEHTASVYDSILVSGQNSHLFTDLPANTTYEYYLVSNCGDNSTSEPSAPYTFFTPCATITQFPWNEGFENGLGCWTRDALNAGEEWQIVTNGSNPTCTPAEGSQMAQIDNYHHETGNWSTLISPALHLSHDMQLSFQFHSYGPEDVFDFDTYDFRPGRDSVNVYVNSSATTDGATLITTIHGYSAQAAWETAIATIPVAAEEELYLIFEAISDYGFNICLDDITVGEMAIGITVDTTICEGDSLLYEGVFYSEEGSYTIENATDTVITLNLTVNPTYTITINDSIAEGETYTQYGFNEETPGTYYQNLTTVEGCDSTIILNLSYISETGIGKMELAQLSVAPNPAHDRITLTTEPLSSEMTVELWDMTGRCLMHRIMQKGETRMEIGRDKLASGLYLLKANLNGNTHTLKVLFQ